MRVRSSRGSKIRACGVSLCRGGKTAQGLQCSVSTVERRFCPPVIKEKTIGFRGITDALGGKTRHSLRSRTPVASVDAEDRRSR